MCNRQALKNYFSFYRAVYDVARGAMSETKTTSSDIKDITTHYMIGLQQRGNLKKEIVAYVTHISDPPLDGEVDKVAAAEHKLRERVSSADSNEQAEDLSKELAEDKPTPWQEVKDSNGNVISQMNKNDLIDVCIKLIPFHGSEVPVIKAGVNQDNIIFDADYLTRGACP